TDARRHLSDLSVSEAPLLLVQAEEASGMLVLGIPDERVVTLGRFESDEEVRDRLFKALVTAAPEVMLSAGRRHPLLREPVAQHCASPRRAAADRTRTSAQNACGIHGDVCRRSHRPLLLPLRSQTAARDAARNPKRGRAAGSSDGRTSTRTVARLSLRDPSAP